MRIRSSWAKAVPVCGVCVCVGGGGNSFDV